MLMIGYLTVLCGYLHRIRVPIRWGSLSLLAIGVSATASLVDPVSAAVIGLLAAPFYPGHRLSNGIVNTWNMVVGSTAVSLLPTTAPGTLRIMVALVVTTTVQWTSPALYFSILSREPVVSIWRKTFSRSWLFAFLYFGFAAALLNQLLDGSPRGFILASIVALLAYALVGMVGSRHQTAALSEQLEGAERIRAYGRSVEGILHNLRNHVAGVEAALAEIDLRDSRADREVLDWARSAVANASHVLRRTANIESPTPVRHPTDLREVARNVHAILRLIARGTDVRVEYHEPTTPVLVFGDPTALSEVAMNLVKNGIEACGNGGRVSVEVARTNSNHATLIVSDTGPGLTKEARVRLFQPHYTTKLDGTGLGLFTSLAIVKQHGGEIVYSEPAHGHTTFTVTFPTGDHAE
jgi:signal transduction histidine kinase